jgi:thiamin-phosphate kinase/energy coupling factor transporter S component ThiW
VRISDLGEFPLIDCVADIVAIDRPDIIVGIGDDVAVLDAGGDDWLLAKVDIQVEGVHFLREAISPRQLGRKSLAINLSDIAAAGGQPHHALVSLALPEDTDVGWVDELYRGLRQEADRFGVAVVGGNMARSPAGIGVDVFVLGRVHRQHLLLRSGAQPGDRVLVTGTLGDAAAGLALFWAPSMKVDAAVREGLLKRHVTPTPRLAEARVIARSGLATAMIDLSDGLAATLSTSATEARWASGSGPAACPSLRVSGAWPRSSIGRRGNWRSKAARTMSCASRCRPGQRREWSRPSNNERGRGRLSSAKSWREARAAGWCWTAVRSARWRPEVGCISGAVNYPNERSHESMQTNTRRVARAVILVAIGVALSPFTSFPIGIAKVNPTQHFVNILSAVLLGPWWATVIAAIIGAIRNALGVGTLLAFPGGMIGAFLAGYAFRLTRNIYLAALGEIVGTGILAALVSGWLVAPVLMQTSMSMAVLIGSFLGSTILGTVLGLVALKLLERVGYGGQDQDSTPGE